MKKVILVCAITFVGFIAKAQTTFGVKAGGNLYTFTGDDAKNVDGLKSRTAFHIGGFANIHVSDMFSVQPELLYSAEGAKLDGGTYQLGYIAVPVMLQYNNPSGFFAEVGPEIGFLASAKAKGGGISADVKDQFKSIDVSAGVGAGYFMSNGFGIGARYNIGLINVIDQDNTDIKNSGFKLSLLYKFGGSGHAKKK